MAEPLLKRTFSRLRSKDRFRRKTDPKLGDNAGKNELVQSSSSISPSSSAAARGAEAESVQSVPKEDISRQGNLITVAKKQNWAKLSSTLLEPPSTERPPGLGSRLQDWESCSEKPQVLKQAWSRRTLAEDSLDCRRKDCVRDLGSCSTPCEALSSGLPEVTRSVGGYSEICISSSGIKLSGQGAYLQSLERSSRAWVLSTGKPQVADEASRFLTNCLSERRQGAEGENSIWYNPIPEEEDSRGGRGGGHRADYGNPWKKRDTEESAESERGIQIRTLGMTGTIRPAKEFTLQPAAASKKDNPDLPQQLAQPEPLASGMVAGGGSGTSGSGVNSSDAATSDSPGAQKKGGGAGAGAGGGAGSVMDRIKSPGTVRRLSMKMRKLPELRRRLSLRSSRTQRPGPGPNPATCDRTSPPNAHKEASSNVISRYHLDSSAPARPLRRSSRGRSAGKGGYLSDGDSPELLPKQATPPLTQQQQQQQQQQQPPAPTGEGVLDPGSFRSYCLSDQPRCAQRLSGLLTVHLLGAEELLRVPKVDSVKEVFCAIQVDGVTRARTALLTCRGPTLPLNHTFNLELERARLLKLVFLAPQASPSTTATPLANTSLAPAAPTRNRVCCLGAVAIPQLFKGSRYQQLCVKLEPRGLLYVKLTLLEQWEAPSPRPSDLQPPSVFGVELRHLVDKEGAALRVPLLIQKCVAEIEKRGLKVVGLYRLCGSAAVKKELRDAFERDSGAVTLTEELYPDINVITGILKDYLRELPSPLITRTLYEVVLEAMSLRPPRTAPCRSDAEAQRSQNTVSLLHCLPEPEKATLTLLLDHLSLVASYSHSNRMTCQNLAVCFGPVLLTPSQESWRPGGPGGPEGHIAKAAASRGARNFSHSEEIASAVDFKRHIEVLHYLLQLWPIPIGRASDELSSQLSASPTSVAPLVSQSALRQRGPRLPLRLELPQDGVVSRRGRGRLESPPCNRYAGDWSICGQNFLSTAEADYDEVAGSESEEEEEEERQRGVLKKSNWDPPGSLYVDEFAETLDLDAPFTCRLSLKDFDTLISDLERELAKQINICL